MHRCCVILFNVLRFREPFAGQQQANQQSIVKQQARNDTKRLTNRI